MGKVTITLEDTEKGLHFTMESDKPITESLKKYYETGELESIAYVYGVALSENLKQMIKEDQLRVADQSNPV